MTQFNQYPDRVVWVHWNTGEVAVAGAVTTIVSRSDVKPGFCRVRALAAKADVVVDLQLAGYDLADEASTVATRILDRIPG